MRDPQRFSEIMDRMVDTSREGESDRQMTDKERRPRNKRSAKRRKRQAMGR